MNKVAIVTGGAGEIGSEIAAQFGLAGYKVVINYSKSQQDAEGVAARIHASQGEALAYKADIRKYQEAKAMVDQAVERWGRVDVLVNCAGGVPWELGMSTAQRPGGVPLHEMDEEEWDWFIDVNLKGTFHCIKAVVPYMMKQGDGHIINVGSGQGVIGGAGLSAYSAAKGGLLALAKSAARELGSFNIKVNTVVPGLVIHQKNQELMKVMPSADLAVKSQLLGRCQTREEFAQFIVYLARTQNITGQRFDLDSRII